MFMRNFEQSWNYIPGMPSPFVLQAIINKKLFGTSWYQTSNTEDWHNGGPMPVSSSSLHSFIHSEQHTILKMLKSAEEAQVKDVSGQGVTTACSLQECQIKPLYFLCHQTISEVMKPGAAKAVKSWLKSADDKG